MNTSGRACRSVAVLGLAGAVLAVSVAASACTTKPASTVGAPGALVSSSAPRITAPAPAVDLTAAVTGNTQLGLDLHRALAAAAPTENLVFSPHSISVALAMTYAGAAGQTHGAFDQVLHQALPEAAYHRALNDLDRQLASRGQGAQGTDGQPFRLDVTNQLFADQRATFEAPFLDTLATEYGAGVRLLDFRGAPDPSRQLINGWVEQKTGGKIQQLLPDGVIGTDTRAVLVNAIYFNAAWATRFEPAQTADAQFRLRDGSTSAVKMMRNGRLEALAATVDGVEVVSVPYDGGELTLTILMPPLASYDSFERALTAGDIARYVAARRAEPLALSMPKFQVRTSAPLRQTLSGLGLAVAFTEAADFSRMSSEPLMLKDVLHQALAIVDENGTVAAAATAVIGVVTSAPLQPPRAVVLDHPFLYLIRDEGTGAIVFLGRFVRPSS